MTRTPPLVAPQGQGRGMVGVGEKVLITTNNWFYGPDGRSYRAVFGTVKAVCSDEETLGIKTNRNATNWYVVVGNMTIAGCQVFYSIQCDQCPPAFADQWDTHEGKAVVSQRPTSVYNADALL